MRVGTYDCGFHRTEGILLFNSKRINPGAATTSTNLFQVTGDVEIKALYGRFTSVTNVVGGPTACSFDLYDGTATVQITSAAGVSCAGATLGAIIKKADQAANALTFLNADQCRWHEFTVGGAARPYFDGETVQKYGVNTYVRFTCTTLAANDFTIDFAAIWTCRYPGSNLVAV